VVEEAIDGELRIMDEPLILERGVVGVIEDGGPIMGCYTSSKWRAIHELVVVNRVTGRLNRILEVSDVLRGGVCGLVTVVRGSSESNERVLDVIGRLRFESGARFCVGGSKSGLNFGVVWKEVVLGGTG
jgi:hypothetical protein